MSIGYLGDTNFGAMAFLIFGALVSALGPRPKKHDGYFSFYRNSRPQKGKFCEFQFYLSWYLKTAMLFDNVSRSIGTFTTFR